MGGRRRLNGVDHPRKSFGKPCAFFGAGGLNFYLTLLDVAVFNPQLTVDLLALKGVLLVLLVRKN